MTLTELRYIVALAREHHFGRAAELCSVSQPTLSVAVKKLEDELGVILFERGKNEISVTPVGERVIEQARRVLDELEGVRNIARAIFPDVDRVSDEPSADLLTRRMQVHEKYAWMLRSLL
jgi:DNA-binding transcriptional LysR family regulator